MNFNLTPAQDAVQQKARQVALEVKGMARKNDREDRFSQDILEIWAQEGFFGLSLPPEYDGGGRDAKARQIYEGTNEIMRLIIAREWLKAEGNSWGRGPGAVEPLPPPSSSPPNPLCGLGRGGRAGRSYPWPSPHKSKTRP